MKKWVVWGALLFLGATHVGAFSLLGPYAAWMDVTNGFRQPGDIGGPMNLNEAYRWNVPVVSYGFDQSFLDYFGSNGVVAVEAAIKILNDLPPASAAVLTNYPNYSQRVNYAAQAQNLWDLKSAALAALLEQLGLTQPTRYVFSIRTWNTNLEAYASPQSFLFDANDIIASYLTQRNFDPQTLVPSDWVNGTLYDGYVFYTGFRADGSPIFSDVIEFLVDSLDNGFNAVADNSRSPGGFYTGLTYDDLGGLTFLLSTNHLAVEGVLPGVQPAGTNNSLVSVALRPGVDKITFLPHPTNSLGAFVALTNVYSDTYLTNGLPVLQRLQRVTLEPDFLFTCADNDRQSLGPVMVSRTGTSNWINNASLNGNTSHEGPGLIVAPIKISFQKLGGYILSSEPSPQTNAEYFTNQWGTFDESTNAAIAYPNFTDGVARSLAVHLYLTYKQIIGRYDWNLTIPVGAAAVLQTSTNFSQWQTAITVTNKGAGIDWFDGGPFNSSRFFRVQPQ